MSGAEGSGTLQIVARILLRRTNAHVNIVCGRNQKPRKRLERRFGRKYRDRLRVMGFVPDIQDIMASGDLLVLHANPNSAMARRNTIPSAPCCRTAWRRKRRS